MFLAHSVILKLLMLGFPGTMQFFGSLGLPGWFAYPVFAAEFVSGVLLVLGVRARWVALADIPLLAATDMTEIQSLASMDGVATALRMMAQHHVQNATS